MKLKHKIKLFLIVGLCIIIANVIGNNNNFFNESSKKSIIIVEKGDDLNGLILKTTYYTPGKIIIDDLDIGNTDWVTINASNPWCSGKGTFEDPYVIKDCLIDGGDSGNCIFINNSRRHFIIQNCTFFNSGKGTASPYNAGIKLTNTTYGMIFNNTCLNNKGNGITLIDSDFNIISNNIIKSNNYDGIHLRSSENNIISRNIVEYNKFTGEWVGGIQLFEASEYNNISENRVSKNEFCGILAYNANNNLISKNTVNENQHGIYTLRTDNQNITISENIIFNNSEYGIMLNSNKNTVSRNLLQNNSMYGLIIHTGHQDNLIYDNFFVNNTKHATDWGTNNKWNSSIIGNYWDNHSIGDINNDGLDETPFKIYNNGGVNVVNDSKPIFGNPFHNGSKIEIDGLDTSGETSWQWISTRYWCYGSGILNDPYVISNLNINGAKKNICVYAHHSDSYFIIKDCNIYNSYYSFEPIGIKFEEIDNGIIRNNYIFNHSSAGISLKSSNNCSILNNHFDNPIKFNTYGINIISGCSNITISNNLIINMGWGLVDHWKSWFSKITGNTLYNNTNGITLEEAQNCTLSNNNIYNNNRGIALNYCHNISVSQNTMMTDGININGELSHFASYKIVTSNTIYGRKIYYYYAKNNLNTTDFTNAGQIILINCGHSEISNCYISNISTGMYLYRCYYNKIFNNTIKSCYNGIYLTELSYYNELINNTITNCNNNGLFISVFSSGSGPYRNKLMGNNISYCKNYGIQLEGDCDDNEIVENYIAFNGYYGIYFSSADADNTFIYKNMLWENHDGTIEKQIYLMSGQGLTYIIENAIGTDYDSDYDGLSDYEEVEIHRTNRKLIDSDSDGYSDGIEILKGTNPLDPNSHPLEDQIIINQSIADDDDDNENQKRLISDELIIAILIILIIAFGLLLLILFFLLRENKTIKRNINLMKSNIKSNDRDTKIKKLNSKSSKKSKF